MKTKQEIINEILESNAKYVRTKFSLEPCAVSIAIHDIECSDVPLENDFWWEKCAIGLDEEDYY